MVLAFEVPNPLAPVTDGVGGAVSSGVRRAGASVLSSVGDAIVGGLARACQKVAEELMHFLTTSSSVHLDQGWWASPRGQSVVGAVATLAVVFMVGFLLLAIIQGLLTGDPGSMFRAALLEVPISVAATVVLVSVTQLLLGVTDEASNLVLDRTPEDLGRFFAGFGNAANFATHGLAGAVLLVLFLIGALLVWIELVVRASLIYWLVAVGPLIAAARVWPAARGAFRKLCELGLALIFSKFAIALALGLGAAALSGGGPKSGDLGTQVGLDLGGLLAGAALMLLAAFTPFVLLRLLPILEVAVVAQGISRSPARAGQTGMQSVYYAQGLGRMAGGGARGASSASGPASPSGGGDGNSPGGGPPSSPSPTGQGGAPGSAAPSAAPASAGTASAGAAGASAAVPAAAAAVPVGVAAAGVNRTRTTADQASKPAAETAGGPPSPRALALAQGSARS